MSVIDDVKVIETIGATVLRNIFQVKVNSSYIFVWFFNSSILTVFKENILVYIRISIFWDSTTFETKFKDIMWSWQIANGGRGQDFEVPRCNRYVYDHNTS